MASLSFLRQINERTTLCLKGRCGGIYSFGECFQKSSRRGRYAENKAVARPLTLAASKRLVAAGRGYLGKTRRGLMAKSSAKVEHINFFSRNVTTRVELLSRLTVVEKSSSSEKGFIHTSNSGDAECCEILGKLRQLDTASLCDADKTLRQANDYSGEDTDAGTSSQTRASYDGVRLIPPSRIRPLMKATTNVDPETTTTTALMAGIARTVKCTTRDDFLAVLRGLMESLPNEVLVVDTMGSEKAVAGELFVTEAVKRGLSGIVVDGGMRDSANLHSAASSAQRRHASAAVPDQMMMNVAFRCYAAHVTPYAGTTNCTGETQVSISCGGKGIAVHPGDIIVGDDDGLLVAGLDTYRQLIPIATTIRDAEETILKKMNEESEISLLDLTNCQRHIEKRLKGQDSALEFRV